MPFIYQSAFLCDGCGNLVRMDLINSGVAPENPDDETSYDSSDFPKYVSDSGESDCPNHCDFNDHCINAIEIRPGIFIGELIDGTLTSDGVEYVRQAYREYKFGQGGNGVAALWQKKFDIDVADIDSEFTDDEDNGLL